MALELVRDGDRWVAKTGAPNDRFPAKSAGFRWDPEAKLWWSTNDEAALKLRAFAGPETLALLDAIGAERAKSLEASRATDADVSIPLPDGLALLPYQRGGVAYSLGRRGVLIADEMGLGKTIQAIAIANSTPGLARVLIVCPASLRLNWAREWAKWTTYPALAVGIVEGKKYPAGADVVIVNYDVLSKHADVLRAAEWDLVVYDEAHYLKNSKSLRAKYALGKFDRDPAKKIAPIPAKRVVMLSGTPIENRPIEAWSLLHALAPETFSNWRHFAVRYCAGFEARHGWDVSGASNLDELQERARAACMVRRLKRDVLTELPPKRRQIVPIPPNGAAGAVAAEIAAYDAAQAKLASLRAAAELAKASDDPADYENAAKALRAGEMAAFNEISKLRHETALAKLPACASMIADAFEGGLAKAVIWAHHHDVLDGLAEALAPFGVLVADGRNSTTERDAAVQRFQTDPSIRGIICGLSAMGVGHTMTAASTALFVEIDWVPGKLSQAEDRCHRIGQTETVLVQHLVLDGSLDCRMVEKIVEKQAVIDAALDRVTDGSKLLPDAIPFEEAPAPTAKHEAATGNVRREALAKEAETITDAQVEAIHAGLRAIAAVCDGARADDSHGFSAADVEIGHSLAAAPRLSKKQAALGRRLCRKYRRQLGGGIEPKEAR